MPRVKISGNSIYYCSNQRKIKPDKEALLFVHGAGGSSFVWRAQFDFFQRDYQTILINLPGHGDSGGEGKSSIDGYRDFVRGFLDALGLKSVWIIGHSMGGAIAISLAFNAHERLNGLVLVGTGAKLKVAPMIFQALEGDFETAIRQSAQLSFAKDTAQDIIDAHIKEMLKGKPGVMINDFRACDKFDVREQLPDIDLPTLIICGDEDQLTPTRYSEYLRERIKDSQLNIINGAGHMVAVEKPEEFNSILGQFLLRK
ncbi:MAG: alpha/beta hydrolase [Deltaproteobacteria bacterium]|nr:MAG: alpha/beta hydrolase [Deltaproteobacteria bacterium]